MKTFISTSNEPSGHARMSIWRLLQESNALQLAAGHLTYRKNTQVLRRSVCGSVELAAGSLIPADGADMLFRDHFSRTEQGDSRRIGDDHLLDDASPEFGI